MPAEAVRWKALARIHYLVRQPKRDWSAYTDAVLAHGKKCIRQDGPTLY